MLTAIFALQVGSANEISAIFENNDNVTKRNIVYLNVDQESELCLQAEIPRQFGISYAPENLLSCEFLLNSQSPENWRRKIIVNFYSDADIENVVPAYDSFIKTVGGEDVENQYEWSKFTFGSSLKTIDYADHIHKGPHVLPRLKLRSSSESEVGVTRFIQSDLGVLQVTQIFKCDSEDLERFAKSYIKQGKAFVGRWKVVDQAKDAIAMNILNDRALQPAIAAVVPQQNDSLREPEQVISASVDATNNESPAQEPVQEEEPSPIAINDEALDGSSQEWALVDAFDDLQNWFSDLLGSLTSSDSEADNVQE